jgi:hypothetical protein
MRETTVRSIGPALLIIVEKESSIRFEHSLIQGEPECKSWAEWVYRNPRLDELLDGLFRFAGGLGPGDRWKLEINGGRTVHAG